MKESFEEIIKYENNEIKDKENENIQKDELCKDKLRLLRLWLIFLFIMWFVIKLVNLNNPN